MDYKATTLEHWEKINTLAVRRFGRGTLAEEAALAVIEKLQEDEWRRVRAFSGASSFVAFLSATCIRLFEDFARKRFGRLRPPLWVETFGGFWKALFIALCVERLPVADAVEIVCQQTSNADKKQLENAAYELLARLPRCGMANGLEVSFSDETMVEEEESSQSGPADSLAFRQQRELFEAVFQLILEQDARMVDDDILKKYRTLQLDLTPEERLLLKLCFQEGMSVTEAGEHLQLNRFQAHGRMRRLLQRIHQEFSRCGLAEVLQGMLNA